MLEAWRINYNALFRDSVSWSRNNNTKKASAIAPARKYFITDAGPVASRDAVARRALLFEKRRPAAMARKHHPIISSLSNLRKWREMPMHTVVRRNVSKRREIQQYRNLTAGEHSISSSTEDFIKVTSKRASNIAWLPIDSIKYACDCQAFYRVASIPGAPIVSRVIG